MHVTWRQPTHETIVLLIFNMVLQQYYQRSMSTILRHGRRHQINRGAFQHVRNSTGSFSNIANGFDWLFDCAPSFYINGDNVQVLQEPSQFYNLLKVQCMIFKLLYDARI
jgi:hypothetical protein